MGQSDQHNKLDQTDSKPIEKIKIKRTFIREKGCMCLKKCIYIKKLLFLSVLSIELLLLLLLSLPLSVCLMLSSVKLLNDLDPIALSEENNVSSVLVFYIYIYIYFCLQ